jgi:hypothetical protein
MNDICTAVSSGPFSAVVGALLRVATCFREATSFCVKSVWISLISAVDFWLVSIPRSYIKFFKRVGICWYSGRQGQVRGKCIKRRDGTRDGPGMITRGPGSETIRTSLERIWLVETAYPHEVRARLVVSDDGEE